MSDKNQNNEFRRELSTIQLTMIAVGAIIGSGVFVLTGIGITKVGNLAPWLYLVAGVFVLLNCVPTIISGTVLPTTGGYYKYVSRLLSPTVGYVYMWNRILGNFSLAAVVLAFGEYLQILAPGIPVKWAALGILLILTVLNLLKIDVLGSINKYIVYILAVAMLLFVVFGIPNVDLSRLKAANNTAFDAILLTIIYFMYALDGAPVVVNLAGECKNPRKSVPIAIGSAVIISSLFYALICLVAVTVVDTSTMQYAPLGAYAQTFMSPVVYFAFILFGALLAITSTINASLMVLPRIMWAGAKDGIFPKAMAKLSKNGIPAVALIFVSIIVAVPIALGFDISTIINIINAPGALILLAFTFSVLTIPKKFPNLYKKSFGWLNPKVLVVFCCITAVIQVRLSWASFKSLDSSKLIGMAIFYGIGAIYYFVLRAKWKKEGKTFKSQLGQYDQKWIDEEAALAKGEDIE